MITVGVNPSRHNEISLQCSDRMNCMSLLKLRLVIKTRLQICMVSHSSAISSISYLLKLFSHKGFLEPILIHSDHYLHNLITSLLDHIFSDDTYQSNAE